MKISLSNAVISKLWFIAGAVMLGLSFVLLTFNTLEALAAPLNLSAVPTVIGFEGYVTDPENEGSPLPTGSYPMTFTVYGAATGGTVHWTETQSAVTVTNGYFAVRLGSVTSFEPNDFDGERWIGVQVGADPEITPRTAIASVPFALNANTALYANSAGVATQVPWGGVMGAPTSVVTGSGTTGRLSLWDGSNRVTSNSGLTAAGSSLSVAGGLNLGTASGAGTGDLRLSGSISQSNPIAARVYFSPTTSWITLTSGVPYTVSFGGERFDSADLHNASDNTKLIARAPGMYSIDCQMRFSGAPTTTLSVRAVTILVNGVEVGADNTMVMTQVVQMGASTVYFMNTNDYAQCVAFQASNYTITVTPWGQRSIEFSMVRLP